MVVKHINYRQQPYYLHRGTTKTGKPRYWFSQKSEGDLVDTIPDGYEIYEHPRGQVLLRRRSSRHITNAELALVHEGIERLANCAFYRVGVDKDTITLHTADDDPIRGLGQELGLPSLPRHISARHAVYVATMRFVLVDRKARLFRPQRYCSRGSIDKWINIGPPDTLSSVIERYVGHLGRESFYELFDWS